MIDIRQRSDQTIDSVSIDLLLSAGYDAQAREKARAMVGTFERFIQEKRDELTALQMIYSKPYGRRQLTYEQIDELAKAIKKPPYELRTELVWQAYERLEASRVRRAGPAKLLANLVSLLRFAIGESDVLEPWPMTVEERFEGWLAQQERMGRRFTPEQMEWLEMIRYHVGTSLTIGMDDFELVPFCEKGGPLRAYDLFGQELDGLLLELNEALAA
jgi:type I restriction enzyme R subunit